MQKEKISLDEWFELVGKSYLTPPVSYNSKTLPAFPSDTIQANTTGQSGVPTLKEAFVFYKDCINTFEELGKPISESAKILDFGIGWGRIVRFFLRELPLENIPEAYARRAYAPFFELKKFMYDSTYQSYPIMFFRKK